MKQRITEEQFNELKEAQKEVWTEFCYSHHWTIRERYGMVIPPVDPLLILGFPSIEEMMEFLLDHESFSWSDYETSDPFNFCDSLWKAVKDKLKNVTN
jgi:hypothetical protein